MSVTPIFQHENLMRRITLLSVACPPLQYFSTFPKKRQDFKNKVFCFDFLLSKTVLFLKTIQQCTVINVHRSSGEVARQILMKFEFSQGILDKYSNIKFPEKPSSGSRVVSCERTDRHDGANSGFT